MCGLVAATLLTRAAAAGESDDHPVARAGALLAAVVPHVERVCGRTFPEPPRVRELSAAEARDEFRHDLRDEISRRYPDATPGQRAALLDASAHSSVASCVARYSFHARAIVLVRASFDAQREAAGFDPSGAEDLLTAVLAHEAVHALDDVYHGLATFYATAPDAEALRARAMVAEGRAVVFGRRAASAAGASEKARALMPGGAAPETYHTWLLRLTYEGGAAFVEAVDDRGDPALGERVLSAPPRDTHSVFHPAAWPDGTADPRPAQRLAAAGLGEGSTALSELQLRARYAALHGIQTAGALFDEFRGGVQVLSDGTNVAVLAFADERAAKRYVERAGDEAPTEQAGSVVLRAFGPAAEVLIARLRDAPEPTSDD